MPGLLSPPTRAARARPPARAPGRGERRAQRSQLQWGAAIYLYTVDYSADVSRIRSQRRREHILLYGHLRHLRAHRGVASPRHFTIAFATGGGIRYGAFG